MSSLSSSNLFEKFTFEYFEWVKNEIGKIRYAFTYKDQYTSLLDYFTYKFVKLPEELIKSFDDIDKEIKDEEDIYSWLDMIKKYALFVRTAEKCFMYKNEETCNLYSEINADKDTVTLYYKNYKDYKVRITFEKTKIKNPLANNIAFSMLMGNEEENLMDIITVEIVRSFGKQMKNVFKFVSHEKIEFKSATDEILFANIKQQISSAIKYSFSDILTNVMEVYTGIMNVYWNDIYKKKGIWIKK